MNHDFLGSNPVTGKENMAVHPIQIDGDRCRPGGHQAKTDDHLRRSFFAVKPYLKSLGVILQHLEMYVQPALRSLPQSRKPDAALVRREQQDSIMDLCSREKILCDVDYTHRYILQI